MFARLALVWLLALVASTVHAQPSSITSIATYGNFETAGVNVGVANMNFDESATIDYRRVGSTAWRRGHPFVTFDGNHMATSLFDLEPGSYELRITLIDPGDGVVGVNPQFATVTTRAEYALPVPRRIVNVATDAQLAAAVRSPSPGDHVRLAPGTYTTRISLFADSGTAVDPIVITSQGGQKPLLLGGVAIQRSNHIVLDDLEIHYESGTGVYIRGSHHTVVRRCYIHDSRPGDANIFIQHSEEATPAYAGDHLIIDNLISDETHAPMDEQQGPGPSYQATNGQCYFGIKIDRQPGGFITIRNNEIRGVVDGISPAGDEGQNPVLGPTAPDLLATWHDQEMDVYDNVIYDVKDDGIEMDGHMVNGRIFRNRIGKCENAVTTSPLYPGPLFVVRNSMHGFRQGCLKTNTGVAGITRNVFFYHNTVRERDANSQHCLYRGEPARQLGFVYVNNIFWARGRVYNGDMYTPGSYHRGDRLDYNVLFSTRTKDPVYAFKWVEDYGAPLNNTRYTDLASFRLATGQESNGRWGDPMLDTSPATGYPPVSKLLSLRIPAGSMAEDVGVTIPGINDGFAGGAPDAGAFEVPAFTVDTGSISVATGGTQNWSLDGGARRRGLGYSFVGSLSGTAPGTRIGDVTVPLVVDGWTVVSVLLANLPPFVKSFGTLDAQGRATAALRVSPLPASLSGVRLDHACIVWRGSGPAAASRARALRLVP